MEDGCKRTGRGLGNGCHGSGEGGAATVRNFLFDQKNYKVLPLRVHSFACDWAATIKGGFFRSDFAPPSMDFALSCVAVARARSSSGTHHGCNLALPCVDAARVQSSRLEVQSRKTITAYFRIKPHNFAYCRLLSPFVASGGEFFCRERVRRVGIALPMNLRKGVPDGTPVVCCHFGRRVADRYRRVACATPSKTIKCVHWRTDRP
jgi:hypothetical protein